MESCAGRLLVGHRRHAPRGNESKIWSDAAQCENRGLAGITRLLPESRCRSLFTLGGDLCPTSSGHHFAKNEFWENLSEQPDRQNSD